MAVLIQIRAELKKKNKRHIIATLKLRQQDENKYACVAMRDEKKSNK